MAFTARSSAMRGVVSLLLLMAIFANWSNKSCGDDKVLEEFDKKRTAHFEAIKSAKKKLTETFDKEISRIRKVSGTTLEQRLKLIAAVEAEKQTFIKSGFIPFSDRMRTAAVSYLASVNKANEAVSKAYEKEVLRATKNGEGARAEQLIKEKGQLAFVVGKWICQGINFRRGEPFTWTLYSDFTVNAENDANDALPKRWSFADGGLIIKNFAAGAPQGGFDDKCQVSWDGKTLEAKNQVGGVYTGRVE